jgi:hypothetical protein
VPMYFRIQYLLRLGRAYTIGRFTLLRRIQTRLIDRRQGNGSVLGKQNQLGERQDERIYDTDSRRSAPCWEGKVKSVVGPNRI